MRCFKIEAILVKLERQLKNQSRDLKIIENDWFKLSFSGSRSLINKIFYKN